MKRRPPQNAGLKGNNVRLGIFCSLRWGQICIYLSIVDSQELVGSGSHVDVIGLTLCTLLVHEGIDRVIYRRTLDKAVHDLKERFSQMRRAFLRCRVALAFVISGFIRTGIYAGKGRQSAPVLKASNIPDLSNELRPQRGADAVHRHDNRILWELRGHLVHLDPKRFHCLRDDIKHGYCLTDQQLGVVILGEYGDQIPR